MSEDVPRYQVWASDMVVTDSAGLVKIVGVVRPNGGAGIVATCFDYATVKNARQLARDLYRAARAAEAYGAKEDV